MNIDRLTKYDYTTFLSIVGQEKLDILKRPKDTIIDNKDEHYFTFERLKTWNIMILLWYMIGKENRNIEGAVLKNIQFIRQLKMRQMNQKHY